MAEVPRHFHFVFGLREQVEPFHLAHYLCLESCRRVNQPEKIFFHYRHLPTGPWWERIAPHLTLRPVQQVPLGFVAQRYQDSEEGRLIARLGLSYAHEADFIRLDALIQAGGVYADMDTLFIAPYPDDLYRHPCVLGEEAPNPGVLGVDEPSLCNAVILAEPGASFLTEWLHKARDVFDGTWSRHSCRAATDLWRARPGALHVAPHRQFYRFGGSRTGLQSLLKEHQTRLDGVCSIHLWAHLWWSEARRDFSDFHAGLLTEAYVRQASTTYAVLARPFLESGKD